MTDIPSAITADDLARLDRAILEGAAGGIGKVRFENGREVTYRTVDEMMSARKMLEAALRQQQRSGGIFCNASIGVYRRD